MLSTFRETSLQLFENYLSGMRNRLSSYLPSSQVVAFMKWSQTKGIFSQLHYLLVDQISESSISDDCYGQLSSASAQASIRNQVILSLFYDIQKHFTGQQIQMSPIKGVWLLENVYPGAYPRTTSDLDLLVNSSALSEAQNWSRANGFTQDPHRSWFDRHLVNQAGHHIKPYRLNGLSIEWHWTIETNQRAADQPIVGELSDLDHFWIIARHLIRHWQHDDCQIKWIFDLLILLPQIEKYLHSKRSKKKPNGWNTSTERIYQLLNQRGEIRGSQVETKNWWTEFHQVIDLNRHKSSVFYKFNQMGLTSRLCWVLGALFPYPAYFQASSNRPKQPYLFSLLVRWLKLVNRYALLPFGRFIIGKGFR